MRGHRLAVLFWNAGCLTNEINDLRKEPFGALFFCFHIFGLTFLFSCAINTYQATRNERHEMQSERWE